MSRHASLGLMPALVFCAVAVMATGAGAAPWKFVVMADSQGSTGDDTNSVSVATLGDMASYVAATEQPDLVVFVGDLTNYTTSQAALESSLNTWKTTMTPITNAGITVYPIRGSHDLGPNSKEAWSDAAWRNVITGLPNNGPAGEEGLTYSVTHDNATLLLMDEWGNNPGQWATVNDTWVANQTAANNNPHLFSFTHSQIVKVEHTFCLDQNATAERNAIVESLTDAGGKVHFTGHMHLSNYTQLNDTAVDPTNSSEDDNYYQVIVAPASQKYYTWSPQSYDGNAIPGMTPTNLHNLGYTNGYSLVEIDDGDVTVTFMRKYGSGDYRPDASFSYTVDTTPAPGEGTQFVPGAASHWGFDVTLSDLQNATCELAYDLVGHQRTFAMDMLSGPPSVTADLSIDTAALGLTARAVDVYVNGVWVETIAAGSSNYQYAGLTDGDTLTLELATIPTPAPSIPEPASATLLLGGLALLIRRRRSLRRGSTE